MKANLQVSDLQFDHKAVIAAIDNWATNQIKALETIRNSPPARKVVQGNLMFFLCMLNEQTRISFEAILEQCNASQQDFIYKLMQFLKDGLIEVLAIDADLHYKILKAKFNCELAEYLPAIFCEDDKDSIITAAVNSIQRYGNVLTPPSLSLNIEKPTQLTFSDTPEAAVLMVNFDAPDRKLFTP